MMPHQVANAVKVALFVTTLTACANRRSVGTFRVVPASPDYLLRSPDLRETPFADVLSRYTSFASRQGWVDLRPRMELRIENAYYQEGSPKHGVIDFLGTEIARFQVDPKRGIRLLSVQSELATRPRDQAPAQELIPEPQRRFRAYRFFYAVVFKQKKTEVRGSVLLGAVSEDELDQLGKDLLTEPDLVCGGQSIHCTVFPESCTVSLEIEILVNGAPRSVPWGSRLASITESARHVELLRLHAGRLTPVLFDSSDPDASRLPLLPGDQITWN
jgi:hypothetical protein